MKKRTYPMWQNDEDMDCMDAGNMMMDNSMMSQNCMPMMLAHAYVPWQFYENAFCPQEALMKGTLFPELWGAYPIPE